MKPKKSTRSRPPTSKADDRQPHRSGFDSLDPSKMGLAMPQWMDTSAEGLSPDKVRPPSSTTAESGIEPESRSIVEGLKVVCICKGIKKRAFWNALDAGICTHEDINRHTGSGSGSCKGRRCGPRILDMLKRMR